MDSPRDQNRITTWMGIMPDGTITPLKVDPITNELMVVITEDSDTTTKSLGNASRDENYRTVKLAVDDDGNPCEIIMKSSNNAIYATLIEY